MPLLPILRAMAFQEQLPQNTVMGRLGIGSGPAQAIPLAGNFALLNTPDQTLAGGANVVSAALPTGNVTIDCGRCPLQYITNNGAFTITAPTSDGTCLLKVTNGASAGAISFSGFTVGAFTGDSLDATNGHIFTLSIWCIGGTSGYRVAAHQ